MTIEDMSTELQAAYAVERKMAEMRREAHEKREQEERERKQDLARQAEERRQRQEAEIEGEIRRRFLATGASVTEWEKQRGQLIAQYRSEVALGKQANADDAGKAAQYQRVLRSF